MSDNYPVDGELRRQADRIEALEQAHAELKERVYHLEAMAEEMTEHYPLPSSIESPAPAPDPVCQCGHKRKSHIGGEFECEEGCRCFTYVPTAEPEPAPLDPVQTSGQRSDLLSRVASVIWNERNEPNVEATAEKVIAVVRNYGRDGAR